jgi:hypothetical protein
VAGSCPLAHQQLPPLLLLLALLLQGTSAAQSLGAQAAASPQRMAAWLLPQLPLLATERHLLHLALLAWQLPPQRLLLHLRNCRPCQAVHAPLLGQ